MNLDTTVKAEKYVSNPTKSISQIRNNWWAHYKDYRLNCWKKEIKSLAKEMNMTAMDICRYIGAPESSEPRFWTKLPKQRDYYIAIGMCLKQPLYVINSWIKKYANKRKLYTKDMFSDLIWIHLINANYNDRASNVNYYNLFESTRDAVEKIYEKLWNDKAGINLETVNLDEKLDQVEYDDEYVQLVRFVEENFDCFKYAYVKPRKLLDDYLKHILRTLNEQTGEKWNLNQMRIYLDDSMINYLSGDYSTYNVIDRYSKSKTQKNKKIPTFKKTHIELCLALGMTYTDVNRYLNLMGYANLDPTDKDESKLINLLVKWEVAHPLQRLYKNVYLSENNSGMSIDGHDELEAVKEMLSLREFISAN